MRAAASSIASKDDLNNHEYNPRDVSPQPSHFDGLDLQANARINEGHTNALSLSDNTSMGSSDADRYSLDARHIGSSINSSENYEQAEEQRLTSSEFDRFNGNFDNSNVRLTSSGTVQHNGAYCAPAYGNESLPKPVPEAAVQYNGNIAPVSVAGHLKKEGLIAQPPPSPISSRTNDDTASYVDKASVTSIGLFERWRTLVCNGSSGVNFPNQRSLHILVCHRNSLYVFGGFDGERRTNDLFGYNVTDRMWRLIMASGDLPTPRDRHVGIVYGDRMLVFGGYGANQRMNDLYSYDFMTHTWTQYAQQARAPTPRHSHSAVVYRDSMFVFGGYDGSYRNDLTEFNLLTDEWLPVEQKGTVPRGRYRTSLVVHEDRMWVFGGHDGTRHLNGVHCFDLQTRFWESVQTEGPVPIPRDSHVACVHADAMFVFGGSSGSAMSDFHMLDLKTRRWEPVHATGKSPTPRFCHAGVKHQQSFYILGGYDGKERLADFQAYDFRPSTLSCVVPPSSIISDLELCVNNPRFSDVTFVVGGELIYAHRIICMRCPYFEALLAGPMMESTQLEIPIPDIRVDVFLSLIQYLYTDRTLITLENAMELFVAADRFGIQRLQVLCENRMLRTISIESAPDLLLAADAHNAMALREKCIRYIVQNFDLVSTSSQFAEMAKESVDLVIEILHSR